jgi:sugar porter (SP) family MFS transporter
MSIFATVGPLLTLAAPSLPLLCVARVIVGYGVGLASVCCPLYVSEMASNETRGRLGTLFQITLTFGIFLAYVVSYCILLDPPHVGSWGWDWRTIFGVGCFVGLANLIVVVFFVHESPLWLNSHRKKDVEMGEVKGAQDTTDAKDKKREKASESEGWAGLVASNNAKQVLLGSILSVSLQLTGTNAIFYYAPVILSSAGFDIASILTLVIGGWNCLTSIFPLFLIDRAGRRPLMIAGLSLMTGALIIVAAAFYAAEPLATGIIALIGIIIFIFGFETGPGANFWVLVSEIFPNSIRESAPSFINMQQWIYNIALTLAFPSMVSGLGASGSFWIFAGIGVACTIFISVSLRESKGADLGGVIEETDKKGKASEELA